MRAQGDNYRTQQSLLDIVTATTAGPGTGEVLKWDGSNWVADTESAGAFTSTKGGASLTKDHGSSDLTTLVVNTTNPGSGSLLADFQVGGSSKFAVYGDGRVRINGSTAPSSQEFGFAGDMYGDAGNLSINGNEIRNRNTSGMIAIGVGGGTEARLYMDAANTLAQRNSTNAQEFRLYGTYADASNYERLSIGTDESGNSVISTEYAGTGTARELHFISGGGIIMSADHNSTDATTFAVNTTNPGSSALLADFQVDSSSVFSVDSSGIFKTTDVRAGTAQYYSRLYRQGGVTLLGNHAGASFQHSPLSLLLYGNTLAFNIAGTPTYLTAGANLLEQRNSTNAQEYRLYGTYTSASDYERGFMRFDGSGNLEIGHEAAGTGTARSVFLTSSGATALNASSTSGNVALNIAGGARFRAWNTFTQSLVPLYISASSTDPNDPSSNQFVIWQSDGTASGDDGDIMLKITDSGGTTKTIALIQPIQIPGLAGNPTSSNGATVTSSAGESSGMSFPDTGDTTVIYSVVIPSGSAGTFSVSLRGDSSATASASEEWAVSIEAKQDDEASYGTAVAAEVTITAASTPHTITSGTITPSGSPTGGDIVYIRITRDVSEESTSSDGDVLLREIIVTFD